MSNKCLPGFVANQQQSCPDTDAVGILSITQSADKTKLYISLTDGTTQTFTLPVGIGPIGPQGNPGVNGTPTIYNDFTGASTPNIGVTDTLNTFVLPANTLKNVGDNIQLFYAFSQVGDAPGLVNALACGLQLNGQTLFPIANGFFTAANDNRIVLALNITLTSATTANVGGTAMHYTNNGTLYTILDGVTTSIGHAVTGLNFAINQNLIAVGESNGVIGSVSYLAGKIDLYLKS